MQDIHRFYTSYCDGAVLCFYYCDSKQNGSAQVSHMVKFALTVLLNTMVHLKCNLERVERQRETSDFEFWQGALCYLKGELSR